LNLVPHLDNNGGIARPSDELIDALPSGLEGFASECGLVIALAQEVTVNEGRDQRVLERDRAKKDADENNEFSVRNYPHSRIVIGCDKQD
jgi:hypothetical protein